LAAKTRASLKRAVRCTYHFSERADLLPGSAAGGFGGEGDARDLPSIASLAEAGRIHPAVVQLASAAKFVLAPHLGHVIADQYARGGSEALQHRNFARCDVIGKIRSSEGGGSAGIANGVQARIGNHGSTDSGGIACRHGIEQALYGSDRIAFIGSLSGQEKGSEKKRNQQTHRYRYAMEPGAVQAEWRAVKIVAGVLGQYSGEQRSDAMTFLQPCPPWTRNGERKPG